MTLYTDGNCAGGALGVGAVVQSGVFATELSLRENDGYLLEPARP